VFIVAFDMAAGFFTCIGNCNWWLYIYPSICGESWWDAWVTSVYIYICTARLHYIEPQGTGVNSSLYQRFQI